MSLETKDLLMELSRKQGPGLTGAPITGRQGSPGVSPAITKKAQPVRPVTSQPQQDMRQKGEYRSYYSRWIPSRFSRFYRRRQMRTSGQGQIAQTSSSQQSSQQGVIKLCKYCGTPMPYGEMYCPKCKRAQF